MELQRREHIISAIWGSCLYIIMFKTFTKLYILFSSLLFDNTEKCSLDIFYTLITIFGFHVICLYFLYKT